MLYAHVDTYLRYTHTHIHIHIYRYNIEELRRAVLNGPEVHPGASIVRAETHQFLLQFADRARVAANLKVNFYVLYMWVLRCKLDFQDRKSACFI